MEHKHLHFAFLDTQLGWMLAAATEQGICLLEFIVRAPIDWRLKQLSEMLKMPLDGGDNIHIHALQEQLCHYFNGTRRDFDIPCVLIGTEFQKKVWNSLLQIPYGSTITYAQQAAQIGKPTAIRAVANANGQNKISILLPCHRVIGTDGTLRGYAGNLWRKQKLLELESNPLT